MEIDVGAISIYEVLMNALRQEWFRSYPSMEINFKSPPK